MRMTELLIRCLFLFKWIGYILQIQIEKMPSKATANLTINIIRLKEILMESNLSLMIFRIHTKYPILLSFSGEAHLHGMSPSLPKVSPGIHKDHNFPEPDHV